jgi:SAM-dependent methyltransferase
MTTETNLTIAERIQHLMQHLGIHNAHFAGRMPPDWMGSVMEYPDQILSLTLVCPPSIPPLAMDTIASKLLVFNGDRGPFAGPVRQTVEEASDATMITLSDYIGAWWDDAIADHTETIGDTMLRFLTETYTDDMEPVRQQSESVGEVAGISFRIHGSGPPLLLLPLLLSPSQWEPLVNRLSENFCTIILSGPRLGAIPILEERGSSAGYLSMVRNLIQEAALQPGETVLEMGPGTGVLTRWLAHHTRGANPITGVEVNNYLIGEATQLVQEEGLADIVSFQSGNGEALPYPDDSFDFSFSVTALEEGDADKMLAESVRVTKPGGKVGVIVRAVDFPFVINLPLRPALKTKAQNFPNGAVTEKGCADSSLYDRFHRAGLIDVKKFPQLAVYDSASPLFLGFTLSLTYGKLAQNEQEEWNTVLSAEGVKEAFFISAPYHCAVGTKP